MPPRAGLVFEFQFVRIDIRLGMEGVDIEVVEGGRVDVVLVPRIDPPHVGDQGIPLIGRDLGLSVAVDDLPCRRLIRSLPIDGHESTPADIEPAECQKILAIPRFTTLEPSTP